MAQKQSPAYPNFPLEKAINLASQIFDNDRKNPIEREVAATPIGYSGLSGASEKSLGTLAHYGLVEKAGKGQLRVTQTLVDILYPDSDEDKLIALRESGLAPSIFREIYERFSDGPPSESALKAWLMREEFLDRAINPVTKAYLATIHYLEQKKAFESGGNDESEPLESDLTASNKANNQMNTAQTESLTPTTLPPSFIMQDGELNEIKAELMSGQKVRVGGYFDMEGLEKLERKIQALKLLIED